MALIRQKQYYRGFVNLDGLPSNYILPYLYEEMGMAQYDRTPRANLGIGMTWIGSMIKLDLFFNLYSYKPSNEKETPWGLRFTVE